MSDESIGPAPQHRQGRKNPHPWDDEQLIGFMRGFPRPADAKWAISDLLAKGCITYEQACFMVYLRPDLKHA